MSQMFKLQTNYPVPYAATGNSGSEQISSGNPDWNFFVTPITTSGTPPFTYSWQQREANGTWNPTPLGSSGNIPLIGASGVLAYSINAGTGQLEIVTGGPTSSGSTGLVQLLLTVTNAAGSVSADPSGNNAVFTFTVSNVGN